MFRSARRYGLASRLVILRNHGLLTVGESVDEAAWWFTFQPVYVQVAGEEPDLFD